MPDNSILNRRPDSRFETYVPETPTQVQAKEVAMMLAEDIVGTLKNFNSQSNASPFAQGMIVAFTGGVGCGKTHLLEAIINQASDQLGPANKFAYLSRGNFRSEQVYGITDGAFERKPLVFLDDVLNFHPSAAQIDQSSIEALMDLTKTAYNNQRVMVLTSNFGFASTILPMMQGLDPTGRAASRCAEILAEVNIIAPDHRLKIAAAGGAMARLMKRPAA